MKNEINPLQKNMLKHIFLIANLKYILNIAIFMSHVLDQTSHDTFGILILGTHCVLKIRPCYTLGSSIKIICLAIIQTLHDTCQQVLYGTVPYGTVPHCSNNVRSTEIYVPSGNRTCVAIA